MHIEAYTSYCLAKLQTTLTFPFGPDTAVLKVANKIFTLAFISPFEQLNVKCDPMKAIELRATYESVLPGWHMNKTHWNTLVLGGDLPDAQVYALVDHSYELVVSKLPQKLRSTILQSV